MRFEQTHLPMAHSIFEEHMLAQTQKRQERIYPWLIIILAIISTGDFAARAKPCHTVHNCDGGLTGAADDGR